MGVPRAGARLQRERSNDDYGQNARKRSVRMIVVIMPQVIVMIVMIVMI